MAIDLDRFQTGKMRVAKKPGMTKLNGHIRHSYDEYKTKELLVLLEKNTENEDAKNVLLSRGKHEKVERIINK